MVKHIFFKNITNHVSNEEKFSKSMSIAPTNGHSNRSHVILNWLQNLRKLKRRKLSVSIFSFVSFAYILTSATLPTTHAVWWFISEANNTSWASSHRGILCGTLPGLVRRQRILCERRPHLMAIVAKGAARGFRECKAQFKTDKWNCSETTRDSAILATRETSFVQAVQSASVMHAVASACSSGDLAHCRCDPTKKGKHSDQRGQFTWGGCSDNLRFSSALSRRFMDAPEKRQRDVKSKAILHNNRVGRKSIRKQTRLLCKCHGVSGSCTYRTCWLTLSHLRVATTWLKHRYKKAVQVVARPDGQGLQPRTRKKLRRIDLVYLEKSPDYCQVRPEKGLLGTGGRECNATSAGTDGCGKLCCGRGHYSEKRMVTSQCECSFKWCCYVACKTCHVWKKFHYCN